MNLLILTHYPLSAGTSMKVYPKLIAEGLKQRGHHTQLLSPPVVLGGFSNIKMIRKWLGYIDQFVIFPIILKQYLLRIPRETLIIISDQALGPWVWWVRKKPHVVHCHDFLALQGALNQLPLHRLSWSGKVYQRFIRWGFQQGKAFISVSDTTRSQLSNYLRGQPLFSETALNPLRGEFEPLSKTRASHILNNLCPELINSQYLFHIGRNWYKNRLGVLLIWEKLIALSPSLKLVMVGELEPELQTWLESKKHLNYLITIISHVNDNELKALYSNATALLFPSHAEGFGWPILEAMACGCPVITTEVEPMSEIGGEIPCYLPSCPLHSENEWATECALKILSWLNKTPEELRQRKLAGLERVKTFKIDLWLDKLELFYEHILTINKKHKDLCSFSCTN